MELLFNAIAGVPKPALLAAVVVVAVLVFMRRRNRPRGGGDREQAAAYTGKVYRTSRGRRVA